MFREHIFSENSALWKCEYKSFAVENVVCFQETVSGVLYFKLFAVF